MAAKKKPPNSCGPAGEFAVALDKLWHSVGAPTLRSMGEREAISHSSLSRALNGRRVPTWTVARALIRACGGDPDLWYPRWREAKNDEAIAKARTQQIPKITTALPPDTGQDARPAPLPPDLLVSEPALAAEWTAPPWAAEGDAGDPDRSFDGRPRPRWPLREGIAEYLPADLLETVAAAAKATNQHLLTVLAEALHCDAPAAAELLFRAVQGLRAQNQRLHTRLAWSTPPSPFFPAHHMPAPDVRLLTTGPVGENGEAQRIVSGKSARPPGAHREASQPRQESGQSEPYRPRRPHPPSSPPTLQASTAKAFHEFSAGASVRRLPTRQDGTEEDDTEDDTDDGFGLPALPLQLDLATGTDTPVPMDIGPRVQLRNGMHMAAGTAKTLRPGAPGTSPVNPRKGTDATSARRPGVPDDHDETSSSAVGKPRFVSLWWTWPLRGRIGIRILVLWALAATMWSYVALHVLMTYPEPPI